MEPGPDCEAEEEEEEWEDIVEEDTEVEAVRPKFATWTVRQCALQEYLGSWEWEYRPHDEEDDHFGPYDEEVPFVRPRTRKNPAGDGMGGDASGGSRGRRRAFAGPKVGKIRRLARFLTKKLKGEGQEGRGGDEELLLARKCGEFGDWRGS